MTMEKDNKMEEEKKKPEGVTVEWYRSQRKLIEDAFANEKKADMPKAARLIVAYLNEEKSRVERSIRFREDVRLKKLEEVKCPEAIMDAERKILAEMYGKKAALEEAKVFAIVSGVLDGRCGLRVMLKLHDAYVHRGCYDCAFRCLDKSLDEYDAHEFPPNCRCSYGTAEDGKPRPVCGDAPVYNGPCRHYKPTPSPEFFRSEIWREYARKSLGDKMPSFIHDEYEEDFLSEVAFCETNNVSTRAARKLLESILWNEEGRWESS